MQRAVDVAMWWDCPLRNYPATCFFPWWLLFACNVGCEDDVVR